MGDNKIKVETIVIDNDNDEFTAEFTRNFEKNKQKKLKLATISKYLSPSPHHQSTRPTISSTTSTTNDSKYFRAKTISNVSTEQREVDTDSNSNSNDFRFKPSKKFARSESAGDLLVSTRGDEVVNKVKEENTKEKEKIKDLKAKINESLLKEAVPNCPICAKVFHTFNQRQSHLKKCAQVFRIKTENLVELIKKQQERIERELNKGLVPSEVYTQIQLTSLGLFAGSTTTTKPNKRKGNTKSNEPSKLLEIDEKTKSEILSKRFKAIITQKIIYPSSPSSSTTTSTLTITKFPSTDNYLWDKCKYFGETKEHFYVRSFVDSGQFYVTNRVFIDKPNDEDEHRLANVHVINTQTAFLLAALNDTTQHENLSIYYTQLGASSLNLTTTTTNTTQRTQQNRLSNYSSNWTLDSIREDEDNTQQKKQVKVKDTIATSQSSQITSQIKSARDLFEEFDEGEEEREESGDEAMDTSSNFNNWCSQKYQTKSQNPPTTQSNLNLVKTQSPNLPPSSAIYIDETTLEDSSESENEPSSPLIISKNQSNQHNTSDISSASSSTSPSSSNICDQNLDIIDETVSPNPDDDDSDDLKPEKPKSNKSMSSSVYLIDDEENEKVTKPSASCHVKPVNEKSNCSKTTNKRKSIELIQLSDNDDDDDDDETRNWVDNEERNKLEDPLEDIPEEEEKNKSGTESKKLKLEVAVVEEVVIGSSESSSNLGDYGGPKDGNNVGEKEKKTEKEQDGDDTYLNESQLLSLLNKTSQKMATQSVSTNLEHNSNDVWENFCENQFDQDYACHFADNEPQLTDDEILVCLSESSFNSSSKPQPLPQPTTTTQTNSPTHTITTASTSYSTTTTKDVNNQDEQNMSTSEFDVDEFIKSYRQKKNEQNKAPVVAEETRSSNSSPPLYEIENICEKQAPSNAQKPKEFVLPPKYVPIEEESTTNECIQTPLNNRTLTSVVRRGGGGGGGEEANNVVNLTPMPNYHAMDTPNLKVELSRYGMKALPKRKAILKLIEIYEYTHKHKMASMTRSQSCNSLRDEPPKVSNVAVSTTHTDELISNRISSNEEIAPKKRTLKKQTSDLNLNTNLIGKNQFSTGRSQLTRDLDSEPISIATTKMKKKPPKAPTTTKNIKKSAQQFNLQECTLDEKMLEMVEQEEEENDENEGGGCLIITASQNVKKQPKTLDEPETRSFVFGFLKNDANYYLNVLNYEPLDYEKLFGELQVALQPRKVNNKILMKCLDEFCVTFSLKALNVKSYRAKSSKPASKKK